MDRAPKHKAVAVALPSAGGQPTEAPAAAGPVEATAAAAKTHLRCAPKNAELPQADCFPRPSSG